MTLFSLDDLLMLDDLFYIRTTFLDLDDIMDELEMTQFL